MATIRWPEWSSPVFSGVRIDSMRGDGHFEYVEHKVGVDCVYIIHDEHRITVHVTDSRSGAGSWETVMYPWSTVARARFTIEKVTVTEDGSDGVA